MEVAKFYFILIVVNNVELLNLQILLAGSWSNPFNLRQVSMLITI